ncbi:MAG: DUF3298 domain-containing protein [Eubacteriales bacterium]
MKKICLTCIVLALSFLLYSCAVSAGVPAASGDDTEGESTDLFPPEDTEKTDEITEPPVDIVYTEEPYDVFDDTGKIQLFSGKLVLPQIKVPGNSGAQKAIEGYFTQKKEEYYKTADEVLANSRALLDSNETDYWCTFIYSLQYSTEYIGERYVSFRIREDFYFGGAHSTANETGVVFDLLDGHAVSLSELFGDVDELCSLAAPIILEMAETDEESEFLFDNYKETIPTLIADENFYLSSQGVVFICNTYVLFPYVCGLKYYEIPYEDFGSLFKATLGKRFEFTRFYDFDIEENSENALGYLDTREYYCPYSAAQTYVLEGADRHSVYIVPRHEGSVVRVLGVTYDESGAETGSDEFVAYSETGEDFCLKIICPLPEGKAMYRVEIEYEGEKASIDLVYQASSLKPVAAIG